MDVNALWPTLMSSLDTLLGRWRMVATSVFGQIAGEEKWLLGIASLIF